MPENPYQHSPAGIQTPPFYPFGEAYTNAVYSWFDLDSEADEDLAIAVRDACCSYVICAHRNERAIQKRLAKFTTIADESEAFVKRLEDYAAELKEEVEAGCQLLDWGLDDDPERTAFGATLNELRSEAVQRLLPDLRRRAYEDRESADELFAALNPPEPVHRNRALRAYVRAMLWIYSDLRDTDLSGVSLSLTDGLGTPLRFVMTFLELCHPPGEAPSRKNVLDNYATPIRDEARQTYDARWVAHVEATQLQETEPSN